MIKPCSEDTWVRTKNHVFSTTNLFCLLFVNNCSEISHEQINYFSIRLHFNSIIWWSNLHLFMVFDALGVEFKLTYIRSIFVWDVSSMAAERERNEPCPHAELCSCDGEFTDSVERMHICQFCGLVYAVRNVVAVRNVLCWSTRY